MNETTATSYDELPYKGQFIPQTHPDRMATMAVLHGMSPTPVEGCRVLDSERPVGVVRALRTLPSCDVLEVELTGGGELLIPLVRDAVRNVDVEARTIDVDLRFLEGG